MSGRKRSRNQVGLSLDSDESEAGNDDEDVEFHPAPFSSINWSLTDSDEDSSYRPRRSHSEPSLDSSCLEVVETTTPTRDLRLMHRRRTRTFPMDDDINSLVVDETSVATRKTRWCTSFRILACLFLLCACSIFVPSAPNVPPLPTFEEKNITQQQRLRIRSNGPAFARGVGGHSLQFRHSELENYYQQLQQQEDNEWTWYLHILVLFLVFVWFVKEKRRGRAVCDL